jgi:uncharacterized protein YbjT (DUF2867 family)
MALAKLVLVTGATGYVGGCLVPCLIEKGYRVRVLVHDKSRLVGRSWRSQVEMVYGDIVSPDVLTQAVHGVSTAYYLVHNMASGRDYIDKEIVSARNFASVVGMSGMEHIIYLGGLADPEDDIGLHLRSRINTGDILRQGKIPVTEFRASLIIGSGSISFELIRYLTEQFPIMFSPRWIHNHVQPIAIQNVLDYLISALDFPVCRGKIYEIGGKDVLTYAEVMSIYASLRGLKRRIITFPGIPVEFIGKLAGKLTPVPAEIARPLLGGMRSDSVVRNKLAQLDFPHIKILDYESSVSMALERLSPRNIESIWEDKESGFRINKEGFFVESQQTLIRVNTEAVYNAIIGLGGRHGWLYMNGLWKLRGFLDSLVGGPGLRGRRDDGSLIEGDTLDFYRVEALEPRQRLLLRAEMKAPGLGWMEWRIAEKLGGEVLLTQIAYFAPHGSLGFLYWYILLPVHRLVFNGLIKAIVRQAGGIQKRKWKLVSHRRC